MIMILIYSHRMYICLCNCIKEKHMHGAIANGACSVGDAFRRLGCQPVCGKCVPTIRDALQNQNVISVTE